MEIAELQLESYPVPTNIFLFYQVKLSQATVLSFYFCVFIPILDAWNVG